MGTPAGGAVFTLQKVRQSSKVRCGMDGDHRLVDVGNMAIDPNQARIHWRDVPTLCRGCDLGHRDGRSITRRYRGRLPPASRGELQHPQQARGVATISAANLPALASALAQFVLRWMSLVAMRVSDRRGPGPTASAQRLMSVSVALPARISPDLRSPTWRDCADTALNHRAWRRKAPSTINGDLEPVQLGAAIALSLQLEGWRQD